MEPLTELSAAACWSYSSVTLERNASALTRTMALSLGVFFVTVSRSDRF